MASAVHFSGILPFINRSRNAAVADVFPADAFERKHDHLEFVSSPFRRRDYGLFGFLAGVA